MGNLVSYELLDSVAVVTLDDGKVNALSPAMQAEIGAALDRAEADRAIVVLSGREGVFSGGFDLKVLRGDDHAAGMAMVDGGFELAQRLLAFPTPVVIACTGHAIAMGLFLVLSADYRVGAAGPFRLVANEVAIGMTMPRAAIEICRHRLTPAAYNRAILLAEVFSPDNAVEAGLLDRVVDAGEVGEAAHATATQLATLDMNAHSGSKRRVRAAVLTAIADGIAADTAEGARLVGQ